MDFLIGYPLIVFVLSLGVWLLAIPLKGRWIYLFFCLRFFFDGLSLFGAYHFGDGPKVLIYTALALIASSLVAMSGITLWWRRKRKE